MTPADKDLIIQALADTDTGTDDDHFTIPLDENEKRTPTHDGLWMDMDGDIWVVDVCCNAATLVHDGISWLAAEDRRTIDDMMPYSPFEPIDVPGVDDWDVARAIRREQDKQREKAE